MDELSQAVEMLLTITRSELADSNPQQALAALLHAVRLTRGEDAILEVLNEAKRRASAEMDQNSMQESLAEARKVSDMLMVQDTILAETGDQEILKDAFEDGSSVLCTRCQGLVARVRWESHKQYWCPAVRVCEEDEEESV